MGKATRLLVGAVLVSAVALVALEAKQRRVQAEIAAKEKTRSAYIARASSALDAVRDIEALVSAGIAFSEYDRRVNDARVAVDRFARAHVDDPVPPSRREILGAMDDYGRARSDWALSIQSVNPEATPQIKASMQSAWASARSHVELAALALAIPALSAPPPASSQ